MDYSPINGIDALGVAAAGMNLDQERLRSIGNNLANLATPGYKRELSVSQPFIVHLRAQTQGMADVPLPVQLSLPSPRTTLDVSPGPLRQTGRSLDVAIDGPSYLEIKTSTGTSYTRVGALKIDAQGYLTTDKGDPVMGASGEIPVDGADAQMLANGEVRLGNRLMGQIRLVRFSNPEALLPLGGGLYSQGEARFDGNNEPGDTLRTGYLETSNVNGVREMVLLTETVRHFESMQRIVQGVDDVLERAIRKLGEL